MHFTPSQIGQNRKRLVVCSKLSGRTTEKNTMQLSEEEVYDLHPPKGEASLRQIGIKKAKFRAERRQEMETYFQLNYGEKLWKMTCRPPLANPENQENN
jgi:hypothetical protein